MNSTGSDLLLEFARDTSRKGPLADATHRAKAVNPLCGDEVELELRLTSDGCIERAGFVGRGCVVSQAAASLLCERVEGLSVADLREVKAEHVLGWCGIELSPIRQTCALLAFRALERVLSKLPDAPVIELHRGSE